MAYNRSNSDLRKSYNTHFSSIRLHDDRDRERAYRERPRRDELSDGLYRDLELSRTVPRDLGGSRSTNYDISRENNLKSQVIELETKVSQKEGKILELERDMRRLQDLDEQQSRTIKSLHERLESVDRDASELNIAYSKNELTISELEKDKRIMQDRIMELDERLRKEFDDRDTTTHSAIQFEKQYDEIKFIICKQLLPDSISEVRSHDSIIRRLKEHCVEFRDLQSRSILLEDKLKTAEDECERSRETVKKLFEDIERTRQYVSSTDMFKEERDLALRGQDRLQEELKRMEDRLLNDRDEWEKAQYDLRDHQAKLGEMDAQIKHKELGAIATSQEFKAFKETLATLLGDTYSALPANEESIKERVRSLVMNKQDVTKVTKHLEDQLQQLAKQLEEQAELHKNAVKRARKCEEESDELKLKLKGAEGELTATDILKDGLKTDKHKYSRFLSELAQTMKMDSIVKDLGLELNGDALLARAEQLVRVEEEIYGKKDVQALGMSRQLKDTRRALDDRDVQLNILRKKLVEMDRSSGIKAEQDWEDLINDNKKLSRQVDRLAKQYQEAKNNLAAFKKDGFASNALKITADEQRRIISELERKIEDLESIRSKQARRIATLKVDKDETTAEVSHGLRVTESTIQSLSNEVQKLKRQLEDALKREKQLLDLRQVIARMLGLDVSSLAVPDFEIISRMEKLIESQHETALNYRVGKSGVIDDTQKNYALEAQRRMKLRHKDPSPSQRSGRWK